MSVDEPKSGLPLPETEKVGPLALPDLTRQLEVAEAEVRAARYQARLLQAEVGAAQERVRLIRLQIKDEEKQLRGSKGRTRSAMSTVSLGRTLSVGILAGVGAGVSFALFVMVMNVIYGDNLLDWLHYSAAIALGKSALADNSPTADLLVGLIVHLALAALYGAIFAVAARYIKILRRDLIIATGIFGLGIWIINFYVFSPLLFPWFSDNPFVVQFIAHTLFFGIPLGVILLEFTPSGGILGGGRVSAGSGPQFR